MAYIEVYFNDSLQSKVKLNPDVTTIGRSPDNDVKIDNRGVSSHHARIVWENGAYFVEDLGSTNGTYVNGQKTSRQKLAYGDFIDIFKHSLKYVAWIADESDTDGEGEGEFEDDLETDGTVLIDPGQLSKLSEQARKKLNVSLSLNGEINGKQKQLLTKPSYTIGKHKTCDLRVGGWFAPKIAAVLKQGDNCYYIEPWKRGKVKVNGVEIKHTTALEDGDKISVRNKLVMRYSATQATN